MRGLGEHARPDTRYLGIVRMCLLLTLSTSGEQPHPRPLTFSPLGAFSSPPNPREELGDLPLLARSRCDDTWTTSNVLLDSHQ